MPSARTTIKQAVATALDGVESLDLVTVAQPNPLNVHRTAAFVYGDSERPSTKTDAKIGKRLTLTVLVATENGSHDSDARDAAMDTLIDAVEQAIEADHSLGGACDDLEITEIAMMYHDVTRPKILAFLTVDVEYQRDRAT